MLRPILRFVRRTPERLLHAARRRRALRAVSAAHGAHGVLVMCYGNICRSPFAAAVLSELIGPLGVGVASAGLIGPGRPSPQEAIEAAAARGLDLVPHRSQVVSAALVAAADVIVVMDWFQAAAIERMFRPKGKTFVMLGDLDPLPIRTRGIRDPEGLTVEVFMQVYERIERCAGELSVALGGASHREHTRDL